MHSVQPDMNETIRMMAGNSSSSPQAMNAIRQMRQRPATTSPAYRPGPPTPTRRSTAETSSHMQPKNLDQQHPVPISAPVAMASKKRSSSANVSLDSIQTPSGVMSSASLAGYGKNATAHPQSNAPKKRMRNSTGYPDNLSQMISPMASHRQSQNMMQARIQAAQQQQTAEMQSHRMQAMGMRTSQQQQQQQQLQQQQHQQQHRIQQIMIARANKQSNTQNGSRGGVSVPSGGPVRKTENMVIGKNEAPGTSTALSMETLGLLGNEASAAVASQVNSGNSDAFLFQTMQQQQQQAANGNSAAAAAAAASMANSRNNSRTSPQTRQRPNMSVRSKKGVGANNRGTESSQSGRPSGGVVVGSIANNGPNVTTRDGYNVAGTPRENSARTGSAPGTSSEMMSRAAAGNGRKTEVVGVPGGVEQDKQTSGGGGTPSQRSGVSGVSGGAANKRPAKKATRNSRTRRGGKKGASSPDAPKKSVAPQAQQQPQPPPPQPPPPPPPAATQPEQRKKEGTSAIPPDTFPLDLDGSFMMTNGEDFAMLDMGGMGGMGGMNASLGLDSTTGFEDQSFDGV